MLGKTLGGRYQILHPLGGGGFGQTYLAKDLHLPGKPDCVVKQLKPKLTSQEAMQVARRFFDIEAQALYALGSHNQIPRLFAHFEEAEEFFLVQEFIEGQVFSQELKDRQQMAEQDVIGLLQDVLTVLEFVHQQQVVHRDIKPSNLIRRKSDRRLVLIDFGIVKQIGMTETTSASHPATITIAVGSSGYMPNEQIAGKPRFSSDIYAVGMLAIQCLTGIYPRNLPEDLQTSEILWRDQAKVSVELADILDRMVRYDFRQRYPSAKEALEALQAITRVATVDTLLSTPRTTTSDGHLAWLERGDELFQLQRYKEAVAAYDKVIQAKPDEYVSWFKRGIALENLGCYGDAVDSYDRVVALQPGDYLAWYKRGNALERVQRYLEALQSYDRVVELQPDNYWAWHDRGKVLEGLKRFEEAIAAYDRAVQIKPDFQLAVKSRKQVLSQLKRVDTLYHLQHYDEAVISCDRAIQANPKDSLAWLMRGMALENLERYEEAIEAYSRVVEIQPDDHVAWYKRGNLLEKLQRYDDAIMIYHRVVQIQPDNQWAWHDRARLLEQMQRYEEALAAYDRTVQLRPDFQAAIDGRRRVLQTLQTSNLASAEAEEDATIVGNDLIVPARQNSLTLSIEPESETRLNGFAKSGNASLSNEPTDDELTDDEPTTVSMLGGNNFILPVNVAEEIPASFGPITLPKSQDEVGATVSEAASAENYKTWLKQGRMLEALNRHAEALLAYDQAIQIRNDDPQLWRLRGGVLYALGQYEAAIAAHNQAIQLNPSNADFWCCLGGALTRVKRYREAIVSFDHALQLRPDWHNPWYWRGRLLWELRLHSEAIQSFNKALAIQPDFQPALDDRQKLLSQLKTLRTRRMELRPAVANAVGSESNTASM